MNTQEVLLVAVLVAVLLMFIELKRLEPSILAIGGTANTVNSITSWL